MVSFFSIILLLVLTLLVFWFIATYNFFVSSKARIKASIQEIGNQLKRQSDLIPNLESATKGYLKHEKGIFESLTEARKAIIRAIDTGNLEKMTQASRQLANLLPNIQVMVESNPELKASEVVTKLMDELRDTADKVMYARRLLIDLTADYNVKRVTFPSNIVASIFSFKELPGLLTPEEGDHLKVGGDELKSQKVNF